MEEQGEGHRATELAQLARPEFSASPFTYAETVLLNSCTLGKTARCAVDTVEKTANYDPEKSAEWETGREIRAELIRWLCTAGRARDLIDAKGIRIFGGKIQGDLDLSHLAVPFPLKMGSCTLLGSTNFRSLRVAHLDLAGTWTGGILADGITVDGDLFLRTGFRAKGEVRLLGAQIGGDLDCDGGTFLKQEPPENTDECDVLSLDRAVIKGTLSMRSGFVAQGCVRMMNAEIGGGFLCGGGAFRNPTIEGVTGTGTAIAAGRAVVRGSVHFSPDFEADGDINLIGARIEGNLQCIDVSLRGTLTAEDVSVGGAIFWKNIKNAREAGLNLLDARADTLVDEEKSWPPTGKLNIAGFVYRRLAGGAPTDAKIRMDWLSRQRSFAPQPFRQVSKVMRDEGDYSGALSVLYAMERRRRQHGDKNAFERCWSAVLRWTIGYGYYPGICLIWLLLLVALGWPLYRYGYFAGSIAPSDKDAYLSFDQDKRPPPYYGRFNALIYSLENSFPIVKLGQVDRWEPKPTTHVSDTVQTGRTRGAILAFVSPDFLRGFRWIQVILGWFFATMGLAGVSGLLRKE